MSHRTVSPLPVGSFRTAQQLADELGRSVQQRDVRMFADAGLLEPVGSYQGWPLYSPVRELQRPGVRAAMLALLEGRTLSTRTPTSVLDLILAAASQSDVSDPVLAYHRFAVRTAAALLLNPGTQGSRELVSRSGLEANLVRRVMPWAEGTSNPFVTCRFTGDERVRYRAKQGGPTRWVLRQLPDRDCSGDPHPSLLAMLDPSRELWAETQGNQDGRRTVCTDGWYLVGLVLAGRLGAPNGRVTRVTNTEIEAALGVSERTARTVCLRFVAAGVATKVWGGMDLDLRQCQPARKAA